MKFYGSKLPIVKYTEIFIQTYTVSINYLQMEFVANHEGFDCFMVFQM